MSPVSGVGQGKWLYMIGGVSIVCGRWEVCQVERSGAEQVALTLSLISSVVYPCHVLVLGKCSCTCTLNTVWFIHVFSSRVPARPQWGPSVNNILSLFIDTTLAPIAT